MKRMALVGIVTALSIAGYMSVWWIFFALSLLFGLPIVLNTFVWLFIMQSFVRIGRRNAFRKYGG